MSNSEETQLNDKDNAILKYAAILYRHYLKEIKEIEETSPVRDSIEETLKGSLPHFFEWYHTHEFLLDKSALCAEAGVGLEIADACAECFALPAADNLLVTNWPRVSLGWKGDPLHRVRGIGVMATIHWEDGRILPVSLQAPDTGSVDREWNVGEILTCLQKMMTGLAGILGESDLDSLHDQASNFGDREDARRLVSILFSLPFEMLEPTSVSLLHTWRHFLAQVILQSWLVEDEMKPEKRARRDRRRAARPENQSNPLAESMARQIDAMTDEVVARNALSAINLRDPALWRQVYAALSRKV